MITADSDGFAKSSFKIGKKKINATFSTHTWPQVCSYKICRAWFCRARVHLIAVIACKAVACVAGAGFFLGGGGGWGRGEQKRNTEVARA